MEILAWIAAHFGAKSFGKPALAAETAERRDLCNGIFSVRQILQAAHNSVVCQISGDRHACHMFKDTAAGFSG